jgi:hemoglobin
MPDSLYDRIGGAGAVEAVVGLFYRKVLTDPYVSDFFDTTDMDDQRAKQKAFVTMAFGGPAGFSNQVQHLRFSRNASAGVL